MNKTTNGAADHADGSARVVDKTVGQQLDDLLAGFDTHLTTLRASIFKAEADADIKRALVSALPTTMPLAPQSVQVGTNVYKADAELTFAFTSREQVLALVDALPGLPLVMVAGGCTTFVPEERFVVNETRGETMTPVGEVLYKLSTWVAEPQEKFSWWTRLAGRLVHVVVNTAKGTRVAVEVRGSSRSLDAERVETTWKYFGLPAGELLRWSGGDDRYLVPVTVHQKRGNSFKDAMAGKQDTLARVTADRCRC